MDPRTESLPQNRSQPKPKPNLCPFGCSLAQHDERGYCKHLVGWTLHEKDGEGRTKVEVRRVIHDDREAALHDANDPSCYLSKSDVVVAMSTPTSRVYRPGPGDKVVNHPDAVRRNNEVTMELLGQQQEMIAELREAREADRRELAALREKLAAVVD